ncbi:MAG: MBL fold metallo-hydrolase [Clostridia bacterium]|nr:MBL fold metallo-hydrolase [Clostridia bacterium]
MKILWLGQGGLLFVSEKKKILVDPYLSNSLRDIDTSFKRKTKIKRRILRIKPDAIVLTSSHPDRCDLKTVNAYVKKKKFLFFPIKAKFKADVLCSKAVFDKHSKHWTRMNANPIMFGSDLEWSVGSLTIKGVSAKTDDRTAFGVIITDSTDGKQYYVASNTLYSDKLFNKLPDNLFAAFIPVGGMFGSMNIIDATRFARRLNAQFSVPVLFGTFDKKQTADDFVVPGRIIPKIYKIIQFTMFPVHSAFSSGLNIFFNEKKDKKLNLDDFDFDKLEDGEDKNGPLPVLPAELRNKGNEQPAENNDKPAENSGAPAPVPVGVPLEGNDEPAPVGVPLEGNDEPAPVGVPLEDNAEPAPVPVGIPLSENEAPAVDKDDENPAEPVETPVQDEPLAENDAPNESGNEPADAPIINDEATPIAGGEEIPDDEPCAEDGAPSDKDAQDHKLTVDNDDQSDNGEDNNEAPNEAEAQDNKDIQDDADGQSDGEKADDVSDLDNEDNQD